MEHAFMCIFHPPLGYRDCGCVLRDQEGNYIRERAISIAGVFAGGQFRGAFQVSESLTGLSLQSLLFVHL